jgi:lipopolysaccharide transport system permease protein
MDKNPPIVKSQIEKPSEEFRPLSGSRMEVEPPVDDTPLEYFNVRPRWQLVDPRAIWKYRELLWILALRDLKVRYRQTWVGVAWILLQPLITMAIFLVLFNLLGRQPTSKDLPYALAVMCGLLPWQLFSSTLSQSTASLVTNQNLISKVYFPRLVLPLATVIPNLVDSGVLLLLLCAMLAVYGVALSWTVVLVPAFILLTVLSSLALGIWLAALNAMYRDAGYVVPFLLQAGFFISPVVYATNELIPDRWRPIFALNPMVGAIEGLRWAVLGQESPPWRWLLPAWLIVAIVLATGLAYFRRVERFVADRI